MKTSHAVILGTGLVLAALVFGIFFHSARTGPQTISVVGAASERFDSDIVKWRVTFSRSVKTTGMQEGYKAIKADVGRLKSALIEKGVPESDISEQAIESYPNYGQNGISGYTLQQGFFVISTDLETIESIALDPTEIFTGGVILQNSNLNYFSTKLSDLKMDLLAEASKDARKRAEMIAESSNVKLGPPTSMRAGVFQITEPYSTEVSGYGMHNTQTKAKDISVTVHATFMTH